MADQITARIRETVESLLKGKKSLTEREVKARVAKALKTKPAEIGAGIIRDVRKRLGIDRPAALAYARSILAKDTTTEAKKIISAVGERFGIRLGPPDVSRLRPTKARVGRGARRKPGRPAKAAKPVAAVPAPAPAPVMKTKVKTGRRPGRPAKAAAKGGSISVTFQGSGDPDALAAFFLSLGQQG
jgi:hypothetical protein